MLSRAVAETSDNKKNCTRATDYKQIAQHAVELAGDEDFFEQAPTGLACLDTFFSVEGGAIKLAPLRPEHRQRVQLGFEPKAMPTPMFDAFLHETFRSDVEGQEAEQIRLLQEMAGAIMTGVAAGLHKAFLFYEPYGRAGKGVTERILSSLVPKEFVRAVSPMDWDDEYYRAQLAGARLNVVGELPDDKRMSANSFKLVLGGDRFSGRHPHGRPIYFKNEAAHLFTSNHLPPISEQSEALFARWVAVHFPNSRLKLHLPLDPGLADRIISAEIAGIAAWALEGARRLLANGAYSPSSAHDDIIAKWRIRNNSVDEFIAERCTLGPTFRMRRADFFRDYTEWCREVGRKAFSKGKVFELIEHNLRLGIEHRRTSGGYDMYFGVKKSESAEPEPVFDGTTLKRIDPPEVTGHGLAGKDPDF